MNETDERVAYTQGEPLRIGHRTALLLDDFFVEDRWNIVRRLRPPTKHPGNPLLQPDSPWEGYIGIPSVIWDETSELFRMWYGCADPEAHVHEFKSKDWDAGRHGRSYYLCYAQSQDGIHWNKPGLGLIDYRGLKGTNVVHIGVEKCQGARVIPNHPSTGQPGKYLMSYRDDLRERKNSLCLAYSDDGIHWREDPANPVMVAVRDTLHNLTYDDEREQWLLSTRPISWAGQHPIKPEDKGNWKRRLAVATGKTPQSLSYPRCVIWPEEDEWPHIDSVPIVKCGTHFLAFRSAMNEEKFTEVQLGFSRDGLRWQRLPETAPYIPRGAPGAFDRGLTAPPLSVLPVGDQYYLYYSGRTGPQGVPCETGIGLATLKRDRFVSQEADDKGGYLLTREFVIEGRTLKVNVEPLATGAPRLAAELIRVPHEGGAPMPLEGYTFEECDTEVHDDLDLPITWQGKDLTPLQGQAVQLRFYLRNAALYTVQCAL